MVHMFAPYTVARIAIENASAAVLMLAPPTRNERITRRLRLAADDFHMGASVAKLIGSQQRRTPGDWLDDLRAIARAATSTKSRPSPGSVTPRSSRRPAKQPGLMT
jgi:hypothetical protein